MAPPAVDAGVPSTPKRKTAPDPSCMAPLRLHKRAVLSSPPSPARSSLVDSGGSDKENTEDKEYAPAVSLFTRDDLLRAPKRNRRIAAPGKLRPRALDLGVQPSPAWSVRAA